MTKTLMSEVTEIMDLDPVERYAFKREVERSSKVVKMCSDDFLRSLKSNEKLRDHVHAKVSKMVKDRQFLREYADKVFG